MNATDVRTTQTTRAVRDAIEIVVAPAKCSQILQLALAREGLTEVPEQSFRLASWVQRSLAPEIRKEAGEGAAQRLTLELNATALRLGTNLAASPANDNGCRTRELPPPLPRRCSPHRARSSHRPPLEVMAPPPPEDATDVYAIDALFDKHRYNKHQLGVGAAPSTAWQPPREEPSPPGYATGETPSNVSVLPSDLVLELDGGDTGIPKVSCRMLVASADTELLWHLKERFGPALPVELVSGVGTLMDRGPEDDGSERVALLLDCRHPTVHPTSVAALAQELPHGWWVIAWGIDTLTWEELKADRAGPLHWVRCAADTSWSEVVALSNTLLAAGCRELMTA